MKTKCARNFRPFPTYERHACTGGRSCKGDCSGHQLVDNRGNLVPTKLIQLEAIDGVLYYPPEIKDPYDGDRVIVLCVYDAGDCDTVRWPRPSLKNLRRALFDDTETGTLPPREEVTVRLPNGKRVDY